MPTSMTTAPGLIQSARTCSGWPIGRDQDVGLARDRGRVAGRGVADRDRRVAPRPLLQQQQGHRLADDLRAPEHDGVRRPGSRSRA